ncbi:MAG TPA: hypothetical protein VH593_07810, partial [Ktedonobacteraceae bacterium]
SPLTPTYLSASEMETTPLVLDNSRARYLLNWQPEVSLHDGIQRVLHWYQSNQKDKDDFALRNEEQDGQILTGV